MTPRHPAPAERGFTVVEIIVAAVLVTTIIGAVALAAMSSAQLSNVNQARSSMRDIANMAIERARADRNWVNSDCARTALDATCDLPADLLSRDERRASDATFRVAVVAIPRDRSTDGVGAADSDGVLRDDWDISVTVSAPPAHAARLNDPTPLTVLGALLTERATSGGLIVQYCAAPYQRDERIEFAACDTAQNFAVPGCPTTTEDCGPRNRTIGRAANQHPSGQVNIVRVHPRGFRIEGPDGLVRTKADATPIDASGDRVPEGRAVAYRFEDLPPGMYQLSQGAGDVAPYTVWDNHSIPSSGRINVQDGELSRALVALRQPDTAGSLRINFRRTTWDRTWTGASLERDSGGWAPAGCVGAHPDIRRGDQWFDYQGCSANGQFVYTEYAWGDGFETGHDPPESCGDYAPVYSHGGTWGSCWMTGSQHLFSTSYRVDFTWRFITNGGTASHDWAGASGTTDLQLTPNPLGRAVRAVEPGGEDGLVSGYRSLRSDEVRVARVGSPGGVGHGFRWNSSGVEGLSMATLQPRTRGLHTRERARLVSGAERANVGTRSIVEGDTSANGECRNLIWVRPLTGDVACELTYRGNGECYDRLGGAPGSYAWRVQPCDGGNRPRDCVYFRGANRCGMGHLLYQTCWRMDIRYAVELFGTDHGNEGPDPGGGPSRSIGWRCSDQLDVCSSTQFHCSPGRTICTASIPSRNALPNHPGYYPGVPSTCRNP